MTKYLYAYTHSASKPWKREGGKSGPYALKVGHSKRDGLARVTEQLITAFPNLEGVNIAFHSELAVDPYGHEFQDKDVHRVLESAGVERVGGEWFAASVDEIRAAIVSLRTGQRFELDRTQNFEPREEQLEAVRVTSAYFNSKGDKFLWNAKMRFGKTFTTYLLAEEMDWSRVLVLTYKPAVRDSWKRDLLTHKRFHDWAFIDSALTKEEAEKTARTRDKFVWFASFQDATGKSPSGGTKPKNELIFGIEWDCIVIDEFHYGASTAIARELYDPQSPEEVELANHLLAISGDDESKADADNSETGLSSRYQLHLSGTPFKALSRGDYHEDQIFEWTYSQEQQKKLASAADEDSLYRSLPGMEMYSYTLDGDLTTKAVEEGIDEFSLKAFFQARKKKGAGVEFERSDDVDRFLNLIRGVGVARGNEEYDPEAYPYSGSRFNLATQNSIWLMSNVAQCEAMYSKLVEHPFFSQFEIHKAVGAKAGVGAKALPPLNQAIKRATESKKLGTITLTCGKLMTGVTVEAWTSIFMLTTLKAPESYFQAAFRVQSPWVENGKIQKKTCYVFEFDPQRALSLVAGYGSQIASNSKDKGVTQTVVLNDLLKYLPIYAVADGEMQRLNADELLAWSNSSLTANSLARKIMSPSNFNLDPATLESVLNDEELMSELMQMDDFRDFYKIAPKIISTSDNIKALKSASAPAPKINGEKKKLVGARDQLRKKLQKLNARLVLFMYLTDFREEKLVHLIESIEPDLFRLSTGMNLESFSKLTDYGVFRPDQMTEVIQKYRYFERQSLLAHLASS
ncbi:MAG: DEAD/DEAH box helicase family protein [Aquiluna sp.]|nr:DEAD/DEAH box helicase family protein [Aquiluna sp.]